MLATISNSPSLMLSHPRALPAGFIAPCLPSSAPQPPSGEDWVHEIKHDGFRVIGRKNGDCVKLHSRPGNDLTDRFPLIVETLARLRPHSCIIDGEAVACGEESRASTAFAIASMTRASSSTPSTWSDEALIADVIAAFPTLTREEAIRDLLLLGGLGT